MSNPKIEKYELDFLVNSYQGRKFLADLMMACDFFRSTYDKDHGPFLEGRRSVAVTLYNILLTDHPDSVKVIMGEMTQRLQKEREDHDRRNSEPEFTDGESEGYNL